MTKIPFNIPPFIGTELKYVQQAIDAHKICGDGQFTRKCNTWIEDRFGAPGALLTTSGTTALEMAALLCGLEKGDEVILPSFTFSSTATAIVLTGATPVFVDIRPDTMNLDENKIEAAITDKTKAIMAVHYAGVSCEMDTIMDIARRHDLKVIEDAAQGVMSYYKGRALGTIGDFGCYSFHETKNYSMGEGGAIVLNHKEDIEPAEILREKGTDRARFFRGQVDKYTWVEYGSSYLPSDMNAAYLWAQLQEADRINENRLATWNAYAEAFRPLLGRGKARTSHCPRGVRPQRAHVLCKAPGSARQDCVHQLPEEPRCEQRLPLCAAAFISRRQALRPLQRRRRLYTTEESDRLARLPLYYGMTEEDRSRVIDDGPLFLAFGTLNDRSCLREY